MRSLRFDIFSACVLVLVAASPGIAGVHDQHSSTPLSASAAGASSDDTAPILTGPNAPLPYESLTLDELTSKSDSNVIGKVTWNASYAEGERGDVSTSVNITVDEPIKGEPITIPSANQFGGGGGGGSPTPSGFTGNQPTINVLGYTSGDCQLATEDGKLKLNIDGGTRLLNNAGMRLDQFTVAPAFPIPSATESNPIVMAYDLGPHGATFDPFISLTFNYSGMSLPTDVAESSLYIALWNGSSWQNLNGSLNTGTRTVTANITHFTNFALLGVKTPAPATPTAPTSTTKSALTETPTTPTPIRSSTFSTGLAPTTTPITTPATTPTPTPAPKPTLTPTSTATPTTFERDWRLIIGTGGVLAVVGLILGIKSVRRKQST